MWQIENGAVGQHQDGTIFESLVARDRAIC